MRNNGEIYETLSEAMEAVQRLEPLPKSAEEYKKVYAQDPKLRAKPSENYKDGDWLGFIHYLTGKVTINYETLEEAMNAVQKLVIVPESAKEYRREYTQDSRLPCQPDNSYKNKGWLGWDHFLTDPLNLDFYETHEESMQAVQKLQPVPNTRKEYGVHRCKDPKLPPSPRYAYSDKGWLDWQYFLTGIEKTRFYRTLREAMDAVQSLNPVPSTYNGYLSAYKADPRLPSRPQIAYKNWQNWTHFLTNQSPVNLYETIREAMDAIQSLELITQTRSEYASARNKDPKLPSIPDKFYRNKGWINWPYFLGKGINGGKQKPYSTLKCAMQAVKKLEQVPNTFKQYQEYRVSDPKLPATPDKIYRDKGWVSWNHFLTGAPKTPIYESIEDAMDAIQVLDPLPNTSEEYQKARKMNPALTSIPDKKYKNNGWIGWGHYLTGSAEIVFYETLKEAMDAVRRLKVKPKSAFEYQLYRKEDRQLLSSPDKVYKDKGWLDWAFFLTGIKTPEFYATAEEAMDAVQRLKPVPTSYQEYTKIYKSDPHLPSQPLRQYKIEFEGWGFFLGISLFSYAELRAYILSLPKSKRPRVPSALNKLKTNNSRVCYAGQINRLDGYYDFASLVGIEYGDALDAIKLIMTLEPSLKTISEYRNLRKLYGALPKDPLAFYGFDTFDNFLSFTVEDLFSKTEALEFCKEYKITTSEEYRIHAKITPRLPSSPGKIADVSRLSDIAYRPSMFDVFDFEDNSGWVDLAEEHCLNGAGVGKKRYLLKAFFKYHKNIMRSTVEDQCDVSNELIDPTNWYDQLPNSNKNESTLNVIKSFFEYALEKRCADISEDGEITLLEGYRMPIKLKSIALETFNVKHSETVKPALPFKYIQKARRFILGDDTKTIKEIYDMASSLDVDYFTGFSDWFVVDKDKIDDEDANCIWRRHPTTKAYEMWSPVKLIATLVQLYKPFRGSQIVWLDSGEADEYKLVIDTKSGEPKWEKNSHLQDWRVHVKYHQGFLKPSVFGKEDAEIQMHINTNKTAKNVADGYDVPFIDNRILPFILQLIEWQIKYNPINEPKRWVDAKLIKSVSIDQLRNHGFKGRTCFLFRNPCDGDGQSPINQGQLGICLAAILHLIEEDELSLTWIREGAPTRKIKGRVIATAISNIRSFYTLHSMRVSLITAYIRDAKIAPEIVQKLVGHASLVMTIYYTKVAAETIRQELNSAEEKIIKNQTGRVNELVRQKKLDQLESELVDSNGRVLKGALGDRSSSLYIFDYGLCPNGATLCDTGGDALKHDKALYTPVISGYLGERNCLRCRHFKTGPAFLGGLQMLSNEISLECKLASEKIESSRLRLEVLNDDEYQARKKGIPFSRFNEQHLADSQYENDAKYFDGLVTDLIYAVRYAKDSVGLLRMSKKEGELGTTSLITLTDESEVTVAMEDRSSFEQLDMICQSASFYTSSRPEMASLSRAQLIDLFAKKNGLSPGLFALTPQEQLRIGNEVTNLLLARLGSYEQVSKLMDKDSHLLLSDLGISDENTNIDLLMNNTPKSLEKYKPNLDGDAK